MHLPSVVWVYGLLGWERKEEDISSSFAFAPYNPKCMLQWARRVNRYGQKHTGNSHVTEERKEEGSGAKHLSGQYTGHVCHVIFSNTQKRKY
jgi:hypothetical protein